MKLLSQLKLASLSAVFAGMLATNAAADMQPSVNGGTANTAALHNPEIAQADEVKASALAFANRYYAALFGNDLETLRKSHDYAGQVYGNGRAEESVEYYLEGHLKPELPMLADGKRSVKEQTVYASGHIAVVTTSSELSFEHHGEKIDLESVETLTLLHGEEGWKVVLAHSSSRRAKKPE
jgi:hypothetical protein